MMHAFFGGREFNIGPQSARQRFDRRGLVGELLG